MPAKRNSTVVVDPSTDGADVTETTPLDGVTDTTPDTDVTETTPESVEASAEADTMRINLHVLIDVDPAKWSVEDNGAAATEARDKLKAILMAGGMDEAEALATANKVHKPATATGPNAVRDAVKEYMLAEMRKLSRITEIGAEVNYYERPAK
jgi:hypothetical protein